MPGMAQAALAPPDADLEDAKEARRRAQCAGRWIGEIGLSEKAQASWLTRAKKIVKLYRRADSQTDAKRRFAMLWANTQTIQPAVYSRPPSAVVSRRFKDADPIGRVASEVLERALTFSIDKQDLDGRLRQCSFDFVLLARGQAWERYVPTHGPMVTPEIDLQPVTHGDEGSDDYSETYEDAEGTAYDTDKVMTREDGSPYAEGEPYEPVIFEESITDYVNWQDFGHSVARTWDEVDYVWRRVYLSRKQCIERFGEEIGEKVPLDWGPKEGSKTALDESGLTRKAAVYEIWCKSEKKAYWISKAVSDGPLDERDDPLGLDGFFPCPRPLLGTTGNDSAIPTPDYVYYQDQAEEIDKLTARISELQDALKVRGFYAAEDGINLNNLLNAGNNMMIPVPNWVKMKEGGGVAGNIEWFPIQVVVGALQACVAQRAQLIADVYQITGVSDIQRGESDPRETMGAQKIKASFGSLRVRDRQIEMQRFARDILRIKGEVIAEKFSAETLKAMTGVKLPTNAEKQAVQLQIQQAQMQAQAAPMAPAPGQPPAPQPAPPPEIPPQVQEMLNSPTWEDVEALLQDNAMRGFHIDIETDSTIEPNEGEEKQRTVEFMGAMGQMIAQWGPAVEAQPGLAQLAGAMMKYGVRRFRAGRELEDVIDTTIDKMSEMAGQAPPPGPAAPPIDRTPVEVASIEAQTEQMVQQAETERARMDAGLKAEELRLKGGDQQLKLVAINRDPYPQAQA